MLRFEHVRPAAAVAAPAAAVAAAVAAAEVLASFVLTNVAVASSVVAVLDAGQTPSIGFLN